ncbi:MAG: BREX system ATP-binding domain-containing protein [Kofleriaceae bacterium]
MFGPFRLDLEDERLWKEQKLLSVRRKPFAILRFLAANPNRLVTQDELIEHVWGGSVVSDSAVRSHVHELRQVLGDGVIETVIGRGYRFIAEIADAVVASPPRARPRRLMVGRDRELAQLVAALDRASEGHRQIAFVTGEPGIGKTTFVEAFRDRAEDRGIVVVTGQCIEQHGTPEPFLAMIEMLASLCRTERGEQAIATLARHAPAFMAQLPHLLTEAQHADAITRSRGANEARAMRELVEALEQLAAGRTLVIVLEDLQWSDVATLDLLAMLGQRRERAQLLIVATARRAEAHTPGAALGRVMRPLVARAGALAIALDHIATDAVHELIDARFAGHAFPEPFAEVVVRITGGTPLFVTSLLDDLVARGLVAEQDGAWRLTLPVAELAAHRPDSVKQLIDMQLDRLSVDEQRILEAASLIGTEFSTALVAAAVARDVADVDEQLDGLAHRQLFVRREASEDTPVGVCSRYGFTHGLVLEVCGARSSLGKQQRMHRSIAEALEAMYAGREGEVAGTLAMHFDRAQLPARAVPHYIVAGRQSATKRASLDALAIYERALALVMRTPDGPQRVPLELQLLTAIGQLRSRTSFRPTEQTSEIYERAIALARQLGDPSALFAALTSLLVREMTLAHYSRTIEISRELDEIAARGGVDQDVLDYGRSVQAGQHLYRGEADRAKEILATIQILSADQLRAGTVLPTALFGSAMRSTLVQAYVAAVHSELGDLDAAIATAHRTCDLALQVDEPLALGLALITRARVMFLREDPVDELERVVEALERNRDAGELVAYESAVLRAYVESRRAPLTEEAVDAATRAFRARYTGYPGGATLVAMPLIAALRNGHEERARALRDEMLAFSDATGERVFRRVLEGPV